MLGLSRLLFGKALTLNTLVSCLVSTLSCVLMGASSLDFRKEICNG